ncbi:hypothetical protein ACROYT_G035149 [Oculina patagonica]
MAFKFTCIVLMLAVVFLSAQAKHVKKDKSKKKENDFPKVHDRIVYKGRTYECADLVNVDTGPGVFCGCPFLACSGGQDCYGNSLKCYIVNKDYDYTDMKDEDCDCKWA